MGEQVLVAMSGGVDSSVAAAMLIDEGYEVIGVTMKLWGGESDSGCCSVSDVEDARRVANLLNIEHHVFNFGEEFTEHVIAPYIKDHSDGRTPNPCVECNRHIKFAKLYKRADALGLNLVATGHHAKIVDKDGILRISRGFDAAKDQAYVLHMLDQSQLKRLLLPVGDITKERVREMATEIGMRTADKPDSQDVCFIHSVGGRKKFLGERVELKPADLVDEDGKKVGQVDSIELVTLGQRRGLNLGGDQNRRYVIDIDKKTSSVKVGPKDKLLVDTQPVSDLVWSKDAAETNYLIQCSAHGTPRAGKLILDGLEPYIMWDEPQQKVAAGQSIAFFIGDEVIGGALASTVSQVPVELNG